MCKEFETMIRLDEKFRFECDYVNNHCLDASEYPDFDEFENAVYAEMEKYIKRVQFNPTEMLKLADFLNEHELPDVDRDGIEQVIMVAKNIVDDCVWNLEISKEEIENEMLYCIKFGYNIFVA